MTIPIAPETRPTAFWRRLRADQAKEVEAGTLPASEAFYAALFPDAFLIPCDELLSTFEASIQSIDDKTDFEAVYKAIEAVVLGLNELNDVGDGAWIETDERERLTGYIEEVIEGAGVDLEALAASKGIAVGEITDEWRDW